MTKDEVLARLRVLARLQRPVWLAGGVAVDFHVGRWTRDHHDIDLVTFEEHRVGLDEELARLGFTCTDDRGWITNWTNAGHDPGEVSLAYERRLDDTTGALVMLASYDGVEPGIYPGAPGNLTLERFRMLDDPHELRRRRRQRGTSVPRARPRRARARGRVLRARDRACL
jgi:hypothetical protein